MIIKIKEPFNEQYTLVIDSDMMGVDVHMMSKAKVRWDFTVFKVDEKQMEVRLVLLDHILLDANNSLLKEIAQISQLFTKMYDELHLLLDHKGKVIAVLNKEIIAEKWKQIKKNMERVIASSPDISGVIKMNDEMFSNPQKLKDGIENNEFFTCYFKNVYDIEIPYNKTDLIQFNYFNTANVQWNLNVNVSENTANFTQISYKAHPLYMLTKGFYNRAYSQFSDKIDLSKLNTKLKETGEYYIEGNTGKLIKAVVKKSEEADTRLYTRMTYTFMSEKVYKDVLKQKPKLYEDELTQKELQEIGTHKNENIYKIYKGKNYTQEEWVKKEQELWEEYQKSKK